jgi:hypothetical protein
LSWSAALRLTYVPPPACLVSWAAGERSDPRKQQKSQNGQYPQKMGSDIQDLYRLVEGQGFDLVVNAFQQTPEELRLWVANELGHDFSGRDLRYFAARLRAFADNVDAGAITEEDLSLLGDLGQALA